MKIFAVLASVLALAASASAGEYFVLSSVSGPVPYGCSVVDDVVVPPPPAYALAPAYPVGPAYGYPAYSRFVLRGPAYYSSYTLDPFYSGPGFLAGVGGYGVRGVFNNGAYAEVGMSGGAAFARNGSFAVSSGGRNFAFAEKGGTAFAAPGGGRQSLAFSSGKGGESLAFSSGPGGRQSFAFSGGRRQGQTLAFSAGASKPGRTNVAFAAGNGTAFARSGRNIAFAR